MRVGRSRMLTSVAHGLAFAALGCSSAASDSNSDGVVPGPPVGSADSGSPFDAWVPRDGATTPMLCQGGAASRRQPLIDDFEDGDGRILSADGRNGHWFSDSGAADAGLDAGRSLLPEAVSALDASSVDAGVGYALHVEGDGGTVARIAFDFHRRAGLPCVYDASYYQGISFLAKGRGALRFEVAVPATVTVHDGGICAGSGCGNRHGFGVTLGSEWKRYAIGFLQLAQEPGWGQPASFDPAAVFGIDFELDRGEPYDFWLDDVRFFPNPGSVDAGADASRFDSGSTDSGNVPRDASTQED